MATYNEYVKRPYEEYPYTIEEAKELLKCSQDFYYFLKHVKIVCPDRGRIVFDPYPYQMDIFDLILNNRYIVSLISRQSGKSTLVSVYLVWYAIFNDDKNVGVVSNNIDGAMDIVERCKLIYEELPHFLKPGIIEYNKKTIKFENGTTLKGAATSKNSFRGRTMNVILADELAFIEPAWLADAFYMSNYPTISKSKESKFIIISTPNGIGNLFHSIYAKAEKGTNAFKHYKADWRCVPERDEEWARVEESNIGKLRFNQEYSVEFLGSANTVIDEATLKRLLDQPEPEPIMSQKGNFRQYERPIKGMTYLMGCLPIGEKVITDNGLKNVELVSNTDKLIDIDGNTTNIKNIQLYKDYKGHIYDVSVYGGFRSTRFTSEHPIYCSHDPVMKRSRSRGRYRDFDFSFDKVENLKEGDWVRYPNIYKDKVISNESIDLKWHYSDITRKDFRMASPLLDKDFWWFVGVWLGDGWVQSNGNNVKSVHTCHNDKTERHYVDRIIDIFKRYNRSISVTHRTSTICTQFTSKEMYRFLVDTFGKGARGKYISEWVKCIPDEFKYQLIRGYIDSDGCVYKSDSYTMNIVSISLELLEGVQDILFSLGYLPSICKLRDKGITTFGNKEYQTKETYQLCICQHDSLLLSNQMGYNTAGYISKRDRNKRYWYFNDDKSYIYIRVKKIEESVYHGDVYNYETESHSFLCRGIPTHNCDCAKGTGEHFSTMQVYKLVSMNPIKLEQVAVFEDNFMDTYDFAALVNRTGIYYNDAYLMVENNGEGSAVISELWWTHENEGLVCSGTKINSLGIRATKTTKPQAVILMKKLVEDGSIEIIDPSTINQLLTFIEKGNNKFTGNGKPDDLVSALYWMPWIFKMDILEDSMEFKKAEEDDNYFGEIFAEDDPEEEGYLILQR